VAILVVVATAEFTMGAWEVIWSVWLDSQGHSLAFIGLTWIAFSAPMLLSFAGGRLADRHSRYALMIGGFGVQAVIWAAFSVTAAAWIYLAAAVLGGLAFALAFPAKQALLVQVSPRRWLGSVQGIEQTSMQGAAFVGTLTAPLIYDAIGGWIFAVCGAVALTGVLTAAPVLRREWACVRGGEARSCAQLRLLTAEAATAEADGG
jgi:MFS family permease